MTIANIATLARNLVDADTTSLSNANLLIYFNAAYQDVIAKLMAIHGNWAFEDSNFSSLPTYTRNMTSGTQQYQIMGNLVPTTGTGWNVTQYNEIVGLRKLEVLDNTGIWHELDRIFLDQIPGAQLEYYKTNGQPKEYEIRGDFVILYPAPDNGVTVTLTAGLRAIFDRAASEFADVTSTSVRPGFAPMFHHLLAYKGILPFAVSYKPERVPFLIREAEKIEKSMLDWYSRQHKDVRPIMSMKGINYI